MMRYLPWCLLLLTACGQQSAYLTADDQRHQTLSTESIALNASTPALSFQHARVLTDNNQAFQQKLALIQRATTSIDMAYYIYANDYSSALLSQALLAAAQRGVKVRLLVDYQTNYQRLDFFTLLQQRGNGNIEVRFYNRPTDNMMKDAVFLTLPCPVASVDTCSQAKFKQLTAQLQGQNLRSLNTGGSGLLLSGLYGKDTDIISSAIIEGQKIDLAKFFPPNPEGKPLSKQDLNALLDFATVYLKSRFASGFERLSATLKVELALALYSEKLNPMMDAVRAIVPIGERPNEQAAWLDWQHFTDYLHHKLLLVDGRYFQLGGRNIEDPYHMDFNPLIKKYVFMDTDVVVELNQASFALLHSFDLLWNFNTMVASLDEVWAHAPNDFLVANQQAMQQCQQDQSCYNATFLQQSRAQRQQQQYDAMQQQARQYHQQQQNVPESASAFDIDETAQLFYVENLPFNRKLTGEKPRIFGAVNGAEAESGKAIHQLWLAAMRNTCQRASAAQPQQIWLHNAYFFLPSNMLAQLAAMVDGRQTCGHVTINVLTNSIETTDLGIINLMTRYSMKAFAEYYQTNRDAEHGAVFNYYEYQPRYQSRDGQRENRYSLHSKVSVFGEDMFIGSANTDVRSYMMDSNNGLFIRNAPKFVQAYQTMLQRQIHDSNQVKKVTDDFFILDLPTMLAEDKQRIFSLIQNLFDAPETATTNSDNNNDVAHQALLQRVDDVLRTVYEFSAQGLRQHWQDETYQQRFNAYFKFL